MAYSVKEIFYTLQGEGLRAGRPAVFCRFAGCNLWRAVSRTAQRPSAASATPTSSAPTARCGGKFAAADGAGRPGRGAVAGRPRPPLRRADRRRAAVAGGRGADRRPACRRASRSRWKPTARWRRRAGIDWICVSPKAGAPWVQRSGHELKLVFPQPDLLPETRRRRSTSSHLLLQPMDGPAPRGPHAGRDRPLPGRSALAALAADPQDHLDIRLMHRRVPRAALRVVAALLLRSRPHAAPQLEAEAAGASTATPTRPR